MRRRNMYRRRFRIMIVLLLIGFMIIGAINSMQSQIRSRSSVNIINKQLLGGKKATYTVKSGDCLSVIAANYVESSEISDMVATIKYVNRIGDGIHPGQVIEIPIYN